MVNIRVHNPCNEHTRYFRNYNYFWDKFTNYLKDYFNVEENRYFENAHKERFPVKLNKGISGDFLMLECEYVIENLDTGEFVVMSVSDELTHAILNEKSNPFLKKVIISQFLPKKILDHVGEYINKYSPWTYFQSCMDELSIYYDKRKTLESFKNKLYFKGTSLEDRQIIHFINKDIITNFGVINPSSYFEDLITHKIALSVDGRGEFCYRDVECFGIGVPIIRFEYVSEFNVPLIPNYHYISIPRPDDMGLQRLGNEHHAKLLEDRYYEIINDDEFLKFVSKNAKQYYEDNLSLEIKIKNTFNLLNLNDWL